jgi:hypothetical protein
MNVNLIESCYENVFGYNLERFHKKNSILSEYHTKEGRFLNINDLEHSNYGFEDGISTSFKLINFKNKNFLLGDKSCYPCSIVFSNTSGHKWVDVFLIPNGTPYKLANRSTEIKFNFLNLTDLFSKFSEITQLNLFLDLYIKSFSANNWFEKSQLIVMARRSSLKYNERFDVLYERNLLNPFQLSISSILNNFRITNNDLYFSLLVNNELYLGIDYVISPSTRIKFSSSSLKLLEENIFKEYIYSLSQDEIDSFFEVDFLKNNITSEKNDIEILYDILNIEDYKRWVELSITEPIHRYKPDKLQKANITFNLIKEYYERLKINLRSIENTVRKNKGINLVGSLFNESLLFRMVTEAFPQYTILSQHSPIWLGRQRFDIFIKELNTAIEYNGKQHYEPIEYYGGQKGFEYTIKRDNEKKQKCKINNCSLIEVKYDENLETALERIKLINI